MDGRMLAVKKDKPAPGALVTETDIPKIKPNEVLVKVKACSICGTDLHIYKWEAPWDTRIKPPMIFGHEFAGDIVEVGDQVKHRKVGDYVSAETHVVCNDCFLCKTGNKHICRTVSILGVDIDGSFAEYVAIPEENAWVNDKSIPPEIAALQEPMGNAVHTVDSCRIPGRKVAVFGCGPIGLMSIGLAKAMGAAKVIAIDVQDYRINLAKKMGADVVLNGKEVDVKKEIDDITEGKGIDVFLEMSGSPIAIQQGFETLRMGGDVALLGLPPKDVTIDWSNYFVLKAPKIYGIAGRKMYETWYMTTSFLKNKLIDVNPLITHKFKLAEFEEAMQTALSGEAGKVVLTP